jgi:hypothetical protein
VEAVEVDPIKAAEDAVALKDKGAASRKSNVTVTSNYGTIPQRNTVHLRKSNEQKSANGVNVERTQSKVAIQTLQQWSHE